MTTCIDDAALVAHLRRLAATLPPGETRTALETAATQNARLTAERDEARDEARALRGVLVALAGPNAPTPEAAAKARAAWEALRHG